MNADSSVGIIILEEQVGKNRWTNRNWKQCISPQRMCRYNASQGKVV